MGVPTVDPSATGTLVADSNDVDMSGTPFCGNKHGLAEIVDIPDME